MQVVGRYAGGHTTRNQVCSHIYHARQSKQTTESLQRRRRRRRRRRIKNPLSLTEPLAFAGAFVEVHFGAQDMAQRGAEESRQIGVRQIVRQMVNEQIRA